MTMIWRRLLNTSKRLMKNNFGNLISSCIKLSKLKIMVPVSLTGFTGFFMFSPHISPELILVTIGILLLAISASVMNQIQEVETDSRMKRTQDRPLPSKTISFHHAIVYFFVTLLAGAFLIYSAGNIIAVLIGLFTIAWYNGIYTYAKRITAFAVVPGAITGALPPLIGWVAAGGGVFDKPIIFLEFLFFTGQIPHFWLLILIYGEEYTRAGIPSLTDIMSKVQINRLTFTWVVTSAIAGLFLCYFEIIQTKFLSGVLLLVSAFLIWKFSELIRINAEKTNYRNYSILLDSYFLLLLILLISDRLVTVLA
jgi:heme o synthase